MVYNEERKEKGLQKKKKEINKRNTRILLRDKIKDIEIQCGKLNDYLKKKEEEKKIFQISTVILKQYHSYLYNKLYNNISVCLPVFHHIFLTTCGIIFTNNDCYINDERQKINKINKINNINKINKINKTNKINKINRINNHLLYCKNAEYSFSDHCIYDEDICKNISWIYYSMKEKNESKLIEQTNILYEEKENNLSTTLEDQSKKKRSCYVYNIQNNNINNNISIETMTSENNKKKLKEENIIYLSSLEGKKMYEKYKNDQDTNVLYTYNNNDKMKNIPLKKKKKKITTSYNENNKSISSTVLNTPLNITKKKKKMDYLNLKFIDKKYTTDENLIISSSHTVDTISELVNMNYLSSDNNISTYSDIYIQTVCKKSKKIKKYDHNNIIKNPIKNEMSSNSSILLSNKTTSHNYYNDIYDEEYIKKKKINMQYNEPYDMQYNEPYNIQYIKEKQKKKKKKKKKKNESYIDSYIDLIKNVKVFSFFENKEQIIQNNTFTNFFNNIKNFFFFSSNEKNEEKENNTSNYNNPYEQKKNINNKRQYNILKYQCVIKSKGIKIFLCVCPNCSKHFYLLIKKGSRKKMISKVFHPSHFATLVKNLKKQKINLLKDEKEQMNDDNPSIKNIPYLDITTVEFFNDSLYYDETVQDFCQCYLKINETPNNFYDNMDILLYI
ncbi:hypothetical protein PGSY75_0806100 [Plasmodium gaboni]|uniref:Uncharacterized protein n=1 Tax=Plasmodium gaboni TaxID=647221 RepID=A0A151LN55_9APIC|nr:hypothetical protein PGSY75_0806100 [Plasmodium gaboni]KYO00663.1 hypothetical protein PGSY75_0806100 [Plasmodium gaboni]